MACSYKVYHNHKPSAPCQASITHKLVICTRIHRILGTRCCLPTPGPAHPAGGTSSVTRTTERRCYFERPCCPRDHKRPCSEDCSLKPARREYLDRLFASCSHLARQTLNSSPANDILPPAQPSPDDIPNPGLVQPFTTNLSPAAGSHSSSLKDHRDMLAYLPQ